MKKVFTLFFAFLTSGILMAQDYPWTIVEPYETNMSVTAVIYINGVEQNTDQFEIGFFKDESCRGIGGLNTTPPSVMYFSPTERYLYMPQVNGTNNESFTIKLYDCTQGKVLDYLEAPAINYSSDGYGNPMDPFIISFIGEEPSPTQTFTLDIQPYTENGGWYFISSPVGSVSADDVDGLMSNTYDFYRFDQAGNNPGEEPNKEWINMHDGGTLEVGKGYLYANSGADGEVTTLTFSGTPYDGTASFDLEYSEDNLDEAMRGWNLVGNPFATTATVDRDCYVMGEGGSEIILSGNRSVAAMQGVFVKAASEGETVTFGEASGDGAKVVLNVLKDRAATIDRAMVRFNDNSSLPKFMLDSNNTKIYIPQNGSQFALVTSGSENSLPVNFKARENGTYTLSVDIDEVRMEYLHLFDNKTGADIDLLVQPDYQFTANSHDYEARFTLVFRAMTGIEEQIQQSFCFMNGRNLYFCEDVEGAILCLVDMTGRVVRNETLKGNGVNLSSLNEGVYVVRLNNGDNVKTQKVVVR